MTEPRPFSLKRRLLAVLLAVTAAVWVAAAVLGYLRARHEAAELLDAHLAQSAALLVAQSAGELEEIELEHAPVLHKQAHKVAFQVWEHGTRLRLHSANAPNERLSPAEKGFRDAVHDGERWRVFSIWNAGHEALIQVGERAEARDEIAGALGASLALPLAGALPLLALAIWLSVSAGMRPLERLREELSARDPQRLAPLDAAGAPGEVRPMLEEINRLFTRIGEMIERERRFTADAAHELRTPLAALATQAQVAQGATSEARRAEALEALVAGAARAARLVEQLLTLARLEAGTPQGFSRCDLREIARSALAEQAPRAMAKDLDVALEEGPQVWVEGHPGLLQVLARNLVDNALRYAPAGGGVRVAVRREADLARLEVTNSGAGLPPEAYARLGERFYRASQGEESGSGLGLSIVARIAELHGGHMRYAPGAGGSGFSAVFEL